ncbi:MAG: hypothetical protein LBB22_03665 [Treponema sp.]|nr:hypothetical protein [Treponema sp.]
MGGSGITAYAVICEVCAAARSAAYRRLHSVDKGGYGAQGGRTKKAAICRWRFGNPPPPPMIFELSDVVRVNIKLPVHNCPPAGNSPLRRAGVCVIIVLCV